MANLTLEGKWDLDYSNSDSPSDLLAAQGVGWATRKIISGLQILETLTITGSEVKMEKETKVKNTSDVLKIGADEDVKDDVLGDVKQTVEVSADKKVITITLIAEKGTTVNVRTLSEDGKTMDFKSEFTDKNGKKITCNRKFHRKE